MDRYTPPPATVRITPARSTHHHPGGQPTKPSAPPAMKHTAQRIDRGWDSWCVIVLGGSTREETPVRRMIPHPKVITAVMCLGSCTQAQSSLS